MSSFRSWRSRRLLAILVSLALAAAGLIAVSIAPAQAASQVVPYSGLPYIYVVPDGVTSLTVTIDGAQGGSNGSSAGGLGARITGTLAVTPGEALQVNVGGAGGFQKSGWNGGGAAGGYATGGGGATDLRRGSCAWSGACGLDDRIVVAAGGGGGTGGTAPGGAGGLNGSDGGNAPSGGATGGKGATQSAGGAGGNGSDPSKNGGPGALGQGGSNTNGVDGSGGGGGYYGGGAGGGRNNGDGPGTAGGGGGSSLVPGGLSASSGIVNGDGSVTFGEETAGYSGQQKFTGSVATYTVPAGITKVRVQAFGAGGGFYSSGSGRGGRGGSVDSALTVQGGETLELRVGGRGQDNGTGGWNGGGTIGSNGDGASGGGGGSSDVRRCDTGPCGTSDILIAAGGGGGGTYSKNGGAGGGLSGESVDGAGGGTQSSGGQGAGSGRSAGHDGSSGQGGNGGDGFADPMMGIPGEAGGGGGGGWFGGGGGTGSDIENGVWQGTGGAGGSSKVPAGGATTIGGGSSDDGWILISNFLNPPTDLAAIPDDTQVALTWTAPDLVPDTGALTGYRMQRTTDPDDDGSWVDTTVQPSGTDTSMTETGLDNGTKYYFRVMAINGAGDSDPSNVADATPFDGPPSPTGVAAAPSAPNTLTVSWTAASPVPDQGYKVYVSTNPAGPFDTLVANGTCSAVPSGATVSCTATGLTAGTTYYFAVASVDSGVTGGPSSPGSGVPINVPNIPLIDEVEQGNESLTVKWTAPTVDAARPLDSYELYAMKNGGLPELVTTGDCGNPIDSSVTECTMSDLTAGDTYGFVLRAVNTVGHRDSNVSDETEVISAPEAPSVTGVAPVEGTGKVKVEWEPASGDPQPTSYVVYRSTSEGGTYEEITTGPCATGAVGTNTECVDEDLTPGTTYYYKVAGKNGSVEGDKSAASEGVEALEPPAAPDQPTGAPKGTGGVELTWTDPAPAPGADPDEWEVEMTTDGGTTWEPVPAGSLCSPVQSPCQLTDLQVGTEYKFRVKAKNAAGTSGESQESAGVTPVTAPAAPTGVEVSRTSGEEGSLTVAWTAPSGSPDSYTVYISQNENGPFDTPATCVTGGTSPTASPCQIDGLTPGTTYYVQVSATKSGVEGDNSTTVSGVPIELPGKPGTPAATVTGSLEMTLTWTENTSTAAPVDEYEVQMEDPDNPGVWTTVPGGTCLTAPAPGCTVTGLTDGKTYSYQVIAKNAAGSSDASEPSTGVEAYATPGAPTGVDVTNPTSGTAQVEWTAPSGTVDSYKVYRARHASGPWEEITTGDCGSPVIGTSCDDDDLEDGEYFYKVEAVRGVLTGPESGVGAVDVYTTVGIPSITKLEPGNGKVKVTVAPGSGGKVTTYTVTAEPGGKTCTVTAPATSCTINGLENGKNYTFTAKATNPLGTSEASESAGPVKPVAPVNPQSAKPLKPSSLKTSGGPKASKIKVSWKAPKNPGGTHSVAYYRLKLNLDRCSYLIVNKKLSKNVTSYTFKRSMLLKRKNSTCTRTRGEITSKVLRYRVRVEAFNARGGSPTAVRSFMVRR